MGHELEHSAFAPGEPPDGTMVYRGDKVGDDHRVEGRAAGGDPFGGGEELSDSKDAVFEEVTEPAEGYEVHGMGGFDVLGEDEHSHAWVLLFDRTGGAGAFVGEGGRHADVDDSEIGLFTCDRGEQLLCVAEGGDNLVAAVSGPAPAGWPPA